MRGSKLASVNINAIMHCIFTEKGEGADILRISVNCGSLTGTTVKKPTDYTH